MAGLLDGMTPQQYGLLAAGLGMMGNSRGRSLGESLSAGGIQGLNAMAGMQQAQQEQEQAAQMQQMQQYRFQQLVNEDARKAKLAQALQGSSSRDAIAKALLEGGDIESYLKMMKPQGREGVPTGFIQQEDGSIAPMPIAGGGNYMDYQTQLAGAKAQIPGYGEPQRLQMAINADARAAEAQRRQDEQFQRAQTNQEFSNDLANWRLQNPNYEKNQAEIQKAEEAYKKLEGSLNAYYDTLKNYGQFSRHNPLSNSELQTAYQQATWPIRDENFMNTGVLQPSEMGMLNKALTDPTSYGVAGFRDYAELEKQKAKLLETARNNVDTKRKLLSPETPPPIKGMRNLQKVDNPQAEADLLRKSGDTEAASQLEAMSRRDALRKKYGAAQ